MAIDKPLVNIFNKLMRRNKPKPLELKSEFEIALNGLSPRPAKAPSWAELALVFINPSSHPSALPD